MTRRVVAWGFAILGIAFVVAGAFLGTLNGITLEELALSFGPATSAAGVSFSLIGALVTARRPGNILGPIFLVIGVTQALNEFSSEYAIFALVTEPGTPGGAFMGWLAVWSWAPGFGLLTTLAILLFPDGTLPSPRWRWTIPVIGIALGFLILPVAVASASMEEQGLVAMMTSEVAPPGFPETAIALQLGGSLIALAMMLVSVVGVVMRFRRSRGEERQQLKWFVFTSAATLAFLTFMLFAAGRVKNPLIMVILVVLPFVAGTPTGIVIAIFKYRLYDIDVVINRALVYGSLTGVLAGFYVGLVFAFQSLLAPVTAESDLAIAASTLAVAALFRPARARVQTFIDRRFYRRKVDAQQTLEDFSTHARDEVDLSALSSRLTAVVTDTMQPAHVSLWLKEAR